MKWLKVSNYFLAAVGPQYSEYPFKAYVYLQKPDHAASALNIILFTQQWINLGLHIPWLAASHTKVWSQTLVSDWQNLIQDTKVTGSSDVTAPLKKTVPPKFVFFQLTNKKKRRQ